MPEESTNCGLRTDVAGDFQVFFESGHHRNHFGHPVAQFVGVTQHPADVANRSPGRQAQ
jgi:hypothetical protein